ncbi:MAG TPA: isoleucine--tRNA ligase [Sediminibacterium sp.]|uniref:isoleucine--tRNA ligase n=1 Tax=Sediminibacterium sp. TaxID=1917865 RepID=UPI0008B01591|nr:isoleucine--tRNA ligase [Sediminibacterium sp.]OHC87026.1 MAG: isoleucine--tRNA ligase [Sphingobacteriia bacterium RIFOXYC2_FULL_35_18]OHC88279.1 MAG: isoleucine--tRNA ligase [Sphingobacteriia bacterium RIFOXYD2_FULL_35_12]HLD51758.1 isoleucine--tRNA ligase [Sediminibacterium sp.]
MSAKYAEFSGLNLPAIEQEILAKWKAESAFEKSIDLREGKKPFVFFEGPPSANGMPGIHHVISRTLKDMVCRYKTMQGFQVKRKGGWDTHGLPVELGVEKELGITKEDIGKKISIEDYNQKCREAVLRYKKEWDDITTKMGYWVDLEKPYVTFENNYIETLWWILSTLYKKGYLYESVSIQPYSPAAGTGLSSHELNQPGTYKDVKDTSAVAMFKATQTSLDNCKWFAGVDQSLMESKEVFLMAWTTTPWTLPSNLGLTVGPNIDYVLVKTFNPYTFLPVNVILAKALLGKYFKPEGENGSFEEFNEKTKLLPWTILATFKGVEIEGMEYEQLLPYESNSLKAILAITPDAKPFRVISGDFVTTEDGTGIVHTAPAFGADDYKVGKKFNIGILTMVDREGKFVDGLGPFSNRYVKNYKDDPAYVDVNVDICVQLKKDNRAFKVEKYEHSYPHCWRTDKPILYYPLDAWFIKTTAVKDRMVELNKTINWKPKSTGEGRFGNWLENMVDWNLSRSRYWGTPLPVWRTEDGTEEICIGSIAELNEGIRKANEILGDDINKNYLHGGILDLHKPFVDEIILVSPSGKPMTRVPDLIDVWFDSGAMPYAQWHYPFENKELIDKGEAFPADFIAEGVDQTRGWFYTLHALGVMLFDSVAYKAVVSNGLVLDKNGNKMSKRLGNVVNPFETIEQYGADATRWYLITNASPWDNLKFDMAGIQEVQRKFFGTLYNTYQFFTLYANVDGFAYKEAPIPLEQRPEIDRWILSSLNTLTKQVTNYMNDFEPTLAGRAVETFVDAQLSNWYVRLCRRRFWKGEYETDKISAYQTLYECLETVVRLIAPISPFFSDAVFANLNAVTNRFNVASVHHADFPVCDESMVDPLLEERMQLAQETCSLVLSLRKKVNIKVRQPLQKVMIPVLDVQMKEQLEKMETLIKAEVNVKELEYITATQGVISKKIKANFKTLGAKLGASMKEAAAAIAGFTQDQIAVLEGAGSIQLALSAGEFTIDMGDVEITAEDIPGWSVASKGKLTVALDITLSEDLKQEGAAREFVNRVQNIRKESGFELTDRIFVQLPEGTPLKPSIIKFNDYICREILADGIEWVLDLASGTPIEVNDIALTVVVNKKG